MCGPYSCGIVVTAVGAALVFITAFGGFVLVPGIVENTIIDTVALKDDTEQFERFEVVPVALNFTVRLFNLTNPDEVLHGAVPIVNEVGPYIYTMAQKRVLERIEEDKLTYHIWNDMQFDPVGSYPHTEDDLITMPNVPYHAVLGTTESTVPNLMWAINSGINGIFGEYDQPVATFRVGDILFKGVPICKDPIAVSGVVCTVIRSMLPDIKNMVLENDGSILFSLFAYKNMTESYRYEVYRGINNISDVGRIIRYDNLSYFKYWVNTNPGQISSCNKINGTDSGIYMPFISRDQPIEAINPDICRSIRLNYVRDMEYEGVPGYRFTTDESMYADDYGCYCLNVTKGITRQNGCLLKGACELFTCVGAYLVLSNPHFLFADEIYQNSVIGNTPDIEKHVPFVEVEPHTGIVLRGGKRAQFNVFLRPIRGITATQNFRTTLIPLFWVDEGMSLTEEFVDQIKNELLFALKLIDIVIPILLSVFSIILVAGIVVIAKRKLRNNASGSDIPSSFK
ncbi:sensory neuron membrane protein 2 [Galleria mellonella]|uniref:Sensory neuron membrane protein 2 n=1 Tax=Galleria mellonella TaxID=7137 RepID=A0A6J1X7U5_GALME|nr:sensory neuron membrane protein 2 [Galleria mellonella]